MDFQIELVVARFEEDLRWIRRVPPSIRITIYNKGTSVVGTSDFSTRERVEIIPLKNQGREAETYLRHLVVRYDSLMPTTVFCQGHPFDHAPDFHASLQELAAGEGRMAGANFLTPFTWYGFLDETDDPNGRRLFVPWSKNPERRELSTGKLYEALFGEASPALFHFRGGAQFAVLREAVYLRPRDFYERAHELSASIPLVAHSYERIWDRVFGDPIIDPSTLGPEGVLYRKRIRRLEQGENGSGEIGGNGKLDPMDSV